MQLTFRKKNEVSFRCLAGVEKFRYLEGGVTHEFLGTPINLEIQVSESFKQPNLVSPSSMHAN